MKTLSESSRGTGGARYSSRAALRNIGADFALHAVALYKININKSQRRERTNEEEGKDELNAIRGPTKTTLYSPQPSGISWLG